MILRRVMPAAAMAAGLWGQGGGYSGPSILSRGQAPSVNAEAQTGIRPYLGANFLYDSNLAGVTRLDADGRVRGADSYGVQAHGGLTGYHRWKRTSLGLDYRGNYRHYTRRVGYNGADHLFSLGVSHQVSKRLEVSLRESAGSFVRSFLFVNASGFFNSEFVPLPDDELFDFRAKYLSSSADMTYQQSARTSMRLGAAGYAVRREKGLFGLNGATARGDIAYRYSRFGTVGLEYNFTHFTFVRAFGTSDIHTLALNFSHRLSRNWELALRLGAARVESLFLRRVTLDPEIAAIIGRSGGIEASYRTHYVPELHARLARGFRQGNLHFSYRQGVNPGNGIILTSRRQTGEAGYTYTGVRYWHFTVSGGYSQRSALEQTTGKWQSSHVGLGATREMGKDFHAVVRIDGRRYEVNRTNFKRDAYRVSVGFAWSPGDIPLALW